MNKPISAVNSGFGVLQGAEDTPRNAPGCPMGYPSRALKPLKKPQSLAPSSKVPQQGPPPHLASWRRPLTGATLAAQQLAGRRGGAHHCSLAERMHHVPKSSLCVCVKMQS